MWWYSIWILKNSLKSDGIQNFMNFSVFEKIVEFDGFGSVFYIISPEIIPKFMRFWKICWNLCLNQQDSKGSFFINFAKIHVKLKSITILQNL